MVDISLEGVVAEVGAAAVISLAGAAEEGTVAAEVAEEVIAQEEVVAAGTVALGAAVATTQEVAVAVLEVAEEVNKNKIKKREWTFYL